MKDKNKIIFKKTLKIIGKVLLIMLLLTFFVFGCLNTFKKSNNTAIALADTVDNTENTFTINNLVEFQSFMQNINNGLTYEGYTVNLSTNINIDMTPVDINPGGDGTPLALPLSDEIITNVEPTFNGFLNGNGYSISITFDNNSDGTTSLPYLFYKNNGTIVNLILNLTNQNNALFSGLAYHNYGLIENCIVIAQNFVLLSSGITTDNYGDVNNCFSYLFQFGVHNSYLRTFNSISTHMAFRFQKSGSCPNNLSYCYYSNFNYIISFLNNYVKIYYTTKPYLMAFRATDDNKIAMTTAVYTTVGTYTNGYNDGYREGKIKGNNDALNNINTTQNFIWSIFDAPFSVIKNVFNFDLFGVNIASLCTLFITLMLIFFLIRKIKG